MPLLYFIQAGDDSGPIKIGFTSNIERRVSELQTGNHLPLHVLASFLLDNADAVEQALHVAFAAFRLEGEWFEQDARIVDAIEVLRMFERRAHRTGKHGEYVLIEEDGIGAMLPSFLARAEAASGFAAVAFGRSVAPAAEDWWVVEWSHTQGCVHVDSFGDAIRNNFDLHVLGHNHAESTPPDYVILAIAESYEGAHAIADAIEPSLRAMRAVRTAAPVFVVPEPAR